MLCKLGDKELNSKHVHAIGQLEAVEYGGAARIDVYFIGGKVTCEFEPHQSERKSDDKKTPGSYCSYADWKFIDSEGNWGRMVNSLYYNRITAQINELKKLIDSEL